MNKLPTPEEFLAYTKGVTDYIDSLGLSTDVCRGFNMVNKEPRVVTRVMSFFLLYCYKKGMTPVQAATEMMILAGGERYDIH